MRKQIENGLRAIKKAISWGLIVAVLCGGLLIAFASFYFSAYKSPYMQMHMADISDGWQYGIGAEPADQMMSVLHHVDMPADETLIITRVLRESFADAALMLRSNHQQLRVFLNDELLFQSPDTPNMKNPGMGLHFVPLPYGYEGKLLRIEMTSPYAAYSGAPGSVYIGDIPSLEAFGLFSRSMPHKLLMAYCLAAGALMMGLAVFRRKRDPAWWGDFCFGIFSVLFGFYFPSGDIVAYQFLSPVWVSLVSIGLYYLYPLPLMLYFYAQFSRLRRAFLPAVILMAAFAIAALGLQISGIVDFPDLLWLYNPLYILSTIYMIVLGFAQIKKGGRFIRFTVPWLTLVFLISMQSLVSFYTSRVKQEETLYEMAIFTLIVVVWIYNIREHLRTRAQEHHALLELRTQNRLILQSYQHTTKHLEEVSAIRHEMKNHVEAMRILMDSGEYDKTSAYLFKLSKRQDEVPRLRYCDHYLLNAVLNIYLSRLGTAGVKVSAEIAVGKEVGISDEDLSSLVMNILDNASEALAGMKSDEEKCLELKITLRMPYLYVFCKNTKDNPIVQKDGEYLSTKADEKNHGHGLKIVRKIVQKHEGMLHIEHTADTFAIEAAVKMARGNHVDQTVYLAETH